ncbi:class II aldolase/adducin family protein [Ramlibacter sp. G-1-2-2]|uniref:Class II aldolase/adducin family protein n=1 Tax=Ramlibacter agri TaxID=2728837 RepID=A0A848HGF8_9BURK|nr:class II aldolase/adducin family protein [Ramlibacter agri]NML46738.1 class II aldolase/adducin family protein [Ramlibacter agri]
MNDPTQEEHRARIELAAAYRVAARLRFTDHLATHFSVRVPGPDEHFLINPYGLTFDEVRASNLVKVDVGGEVVDDPTGLGINRAGFVIHSALHRARPDVHCVLHTHTAAGIGVAAQEDGLLMASQHAMLFHGHLAYHEYEGVATDLDEQQRLVRDLGANDAMILRNHGLLTCGPTVAHAFTLLYYLERACAAQIAAQSGGARLHTVPPAVAEKVGAVRDSARWPDLAQRNWDAFVREQDRVDASYKA